MGSERRKRLDEGESPLQLGSTLAPRLMTRTSLVIATALVLTACGKPGAPEVTSDPARGLRTFTDTDPILSEIAVEAARSLPMEGRTTPAFGGVYVDGRRYRAASEAVARATGFTATSGSGPVRPECRSVNQTTGASTPIPCPASASSSIPVVYSFAEVRATADSAYVGSTKAAANSASAATCITLSRSEGRWMVLRTVPIGDAKRCGR